MGNWSVLRTTEVLYWIFYAFVSRSDATGTLDKDLHEPRASVVFRTVIRMTGMISVTGVIRGTRMTGIFGKTRMAGLT